MSDRIFGLILTALALALFASATQLESPFFADPVGPKTFPMLIAGAALLSALVMISLPDQEPNWPNFLTLKKLGLALLVLVFYALTLKPLGFLLPTALASAILSFQISPKLVGSVATGIGLSAGLFCIFKFGLGLSLFPFPRVLFG